MANSEAEPSLERMLAVMSARMDADAMTDTDRLKIRKEWLDLLQTLLDQPGTPIAYMVTVLHTTADDRMAGRTLVGGGPQTLMFVEDLLHQDMREKFEANGFCTCAVCVHGMIANLQEAFKGQAVEQTHITEVCGTETKH